jgi:glycosyltransferase involved in cell wall biosynthesis
VHLHWIHDFLGGSTGRPSRRTVLAFDWQLRLLKARGVRLVWTVHNLQGHEADGDSRDADAHRALIERADAIILHCRHARAALIERYRPSAAARARMHVLQHGNYVRQYDVDADADAARATLGLQGVGPVFAFVGSIRGYKGVGELLEAFAEASREVSAGEPPAFDMAAAVDGPRSTGARPAPKDAPSLPKDAPPPPLGPEARLLVWGKPLPPRLGRDLEARAAHDPRIVLRLERIPEEDLSILLRASHAVVLPFRDILTSGSAILALSHGRPVIAPAMGCLPETLPGDATFLYDPNDPAALSQALRQAAVTDLADMGLRARAFADGLDWGPIAARTATLYQGT